VVSSGGNCSTCRKILATPQVFPRLLHQRVSECLGVAWASARPFWQRVSPRRPVQGHCPKRTARPALENQRRKGGGDLKRAGLRSRVWRHRDSVAAQPFGPVVDSASTRSSSTRASVRVACKSATLRCSSVAAMSNSLVWSTASASCAVAPAIASRGMGLCSGRTGPESKRPCNPRSNLAPAVAEQQPGVAFG